MDELFGNILLTICLKRYTPIISKYDVPDQLSRESSHFHNIKEFGLQLIILPLMNFYV